MYNLKKNDTNELIYKIELDLQTEKTDLWSPSVAVLPSLSHVRLSATPRMVAGQALLPLRFPRQEYWSGLPFPSPGDLPDPGIKPVSPALAGRFFTTEPPGKPIVTKSGDKFGVCDEQLHATVYKMDKEQDPTV